MKSWPQWRSRIGKRVVATSEDREAIRRAALCRLISRRLQAVEISEATRATRLTFSLGLVLETTTTIPSLRRVPHWLLHERAEEEESWDGVMLGTSGRTGRPGRPKRVAIPLGWARAAVQVENGVRRPRIKLQGHRSEEAVGPR